MSLFAITLLVLLTLYAIYFYDKRFNAGEKRIILNKYLKKGDSFSAESVPQSTVNAPKSIVDDKATEQTKNRILAEISENGALIFDENQLKGIIQGKLCWDLRTNKFKKTGYIGLIAKGSKAVCGIAKINTYHGPMSKEALKANKTKHGFLVKEINTADFKKNVAIELTEVHAFAEPIEYVHKPGAVMWVKVGEQPDVMKAIRTALSK